MTYQIKWKEEAMWFLLLFVGSIVTDYLSSSDADILADPKTWLLGAALAALRLAVAGVIKPLFAFIKSRA